MNKELPTIEIKGQTGSGKTSLAYLIKLALQEYGIKADIKEYYGKVLGESEENLIFKHWPKSLEHFKGQTIQINTNQLKRDNPSIPLEDIEFVETPSAVEKEAIEEYNRQLDKEEHYNITEYPDNFMGFKP
jgi:hypothetical protein